MEGKENNTVAELCITEWGGKVYGADARAVWMVGSTAPTFRHTPYTIYHLPYTSGPLAQCLLDRGLFSFLTEWPDFCWQD